MLTKVCDEIEDQKEMGRIIKDLRDTIAHIKPTYDFSRGIGLAAPQIGEIVRISIIESVGQEYVLVNPEIISRSGKKQKVREGCLSFFEFRGYVPRHTKVTVKALDENGQEYEIEAQGDFAALLQHEIDHLNGILYVDRLPNGDDDLIISTKDVKSTIEALS